MNLEDIPIINPPQQDPDKKKKLRLEDIPKVEEKPKGTPRGYGETFGRAAVQGASFNFGDELMGLRNAGPRGIPETLGPIPLRLLAGAARTGFSALTGLDPEAIKQYEAGRDEWRTAVKEGEEQNPKTALAGNVTGALAGAATTGGITLPAKAFGLAGAALTAKEIARRELAKRVAEGAATGAASGVASGVGEGENLEDRLTKGAVGGAIGGVVGGAVPAAISGVAAVARPVTDKIASTVRGFRDPAAEAERRVASAIDRDFQITPNAADRVRDVGENIRSGGPATLMDLGDETTRGLARSAANQSPEGRAVLNQTINDRFEGQSGRINQWFRENFHYPDAEAQSLALQQTAKTVNKPNYAKAYSEGSNLPWDETFEQIVQAPEVQGAVRKAMVNAKSEAAKMGFTPPKNPFFFDEATGRLKLRTDGETTMTPNLQFWDIVKRNLDQGDRNSQSWAKILRDRLDEIVPSYQQARRGAAHFFDADNALEAGGNFLGKNMSPGEARRALAKMSDTEKQLFQDGFVSKYMDTLSGVADRRDVLNKIAESPKAREKLHIALGPEKATELEAKLRVEGLMDLARRAVQGNSTTVRQLAEMGLAGSAGYGLSGGGANPFSSPGAVITGLLSAGAAKGRLHIEGNVARKIADLLVSQNPRDLKRGIEIIRKTPKFMDALRGADKYIARVAGEEAS